MKTLIKNWLALFSFILFFVNLFHLFIKSNELYNLHSNLSDLRIEKFQINGFRGSYRSISGFYGHLVSDTTIIEHVYERDYLGDFKQIYLEYEEKTIIDVWYIKSNKFIFPKFHKNKYDFYKYFSEYIIFSNVYFLVKLFTIVFCTYLIFRFIDRN